MSAKLEDLVVHLKGEVSGLKTSLGQAQSEIKRFSSSATTSLNTLETRTKSVGLAFGRLGGLAGAYFGVQTVTAIGRASMQMEALQSRMAAAVGDTTQAGEAMAFVRAEAERLGLYFPTAANGFAGFAASALRAGLAMKDVQAIFTGVATAATAMKLSVADQDLVFKALEQMASKGTVSMEELRGQLGERLPGALQIFAKAMGVSSAQFIDMVGNGQVGAEALIKLGEGLKNEFAGSLGTAVNSAQASLNRFNNTVFELQTRMADTGAMDLFTDSLQLLSDLLSSPIISGGLTLISSALQGLQTGFKFASLEVGLFYAMLVKVKDTLAGGGAVSIKDIMDEYSRELSGLRAQHGGGDKRSLPAGGSGLPGASAGVGSYDKEASKEAEKHAKTIAKVVDQLRFRNDQMRRTNDQQELYNQLRSAGVSLDSEAGQEIEKLVNSYNKLHNAQEEEKEKLERQKELVRDLGLTFSSAFEDAIVQGNGLRSVLQGIFQDLARLVVRKGITEPAMGWLSDLFTGSGKKGSGGGLFSGIGDFFSGLFGRASGGSVSPRTPYMVGERGPELFVPNVGGSVMNKNQVSGDSSGVTVNQVINVSTGVAQTVRAEITRMMPELREMSVQAVQDATSRGAMRA